VLETTLSTQEKNVASVVFVEDGLGELAQKKLFSHKKKISLLNDNKG
jgi:hypothetical protein